MSTALKKAQRDNQALFNNWYSCIETMRTILMHYRSDLRMEVWFPLEAQIKHFEASDLGKKPK